MTDQVQSALSKLGISQPLAGVAIGDQWQTGQGEPLEVHSPIDGSLLAAFDMASDDQVDGAIESAAAAFRVWRSVACACAGRVCAPIWHAAPRAQRGSGHARELGGGQDYAGVARRSAGD